MASPDRNCEKHGPKTPSPKPFKEPEGMMSIELNKNGYEINETATVEKRIIRYKIEVAEIFKVILMVLAFFSLGVLILLTVILFTSQGGTQSEQVENSRDTAKIKFVQACKASKTFEDCCHIFIQVKLFKGDEKCTVEKVLNLFMQYELEANNRFKRQNTEYYSQDDQHQDPSSQYYQQDTNPYYPSSAHEKIEYPPQDNWPPIEDYQEPNSHRYPPVPNTNYEVPNEYQYKENLLYPIYTEPEHVVQPDQQYQTYFPATPTADSISPQPNNFNVLRPSHINNPANIEPLQAQPIYPGYIEQNPTDQIQEEDPSAFLKFPIPLPVLPQPNNYNVKTPMQNERNFLSPQVPLVKKFLAPKTKPPRSTTTTSTTTPSSSTLLPRTCPDDDCPLVINATTEIANITHIVGTAAKIHLDLNQTNIRISPIKSENKERISQGNDFEVKTKFDNFPNMEMQPKQIPCYNPYPTPFSYPFRDNSQMLPMNQGGPHQSMYVINPPMYPYIPVQYQNTPQHQYQNVPQSMINSMYPNFARNPMHVTGPSGQYYMCNPVTSGSSNIAGIPGVEVRKASVPSTLQEMMEVNKEELSSNKTRAAMDCPESEHGCHDGSKCINLRRVCDNEVDCSDGSDEMFCTCKERVGEIRLCDGYLDCPNGEDEQGCFDCEENEFSCDDWSRFRHGTCIPIEQRCDGTKQCDITGKDEEDCAVLTDHLGHHSFYKISNAVGFLHRNYRGRWYPTCFGGESLGLDVCRIEAGPSEMLPKIHMMLSDDKYEGSFVNFSPTRGARLVGTCMENRAAFVECPPLFCGLRMSIRNPFRTSEVDTSIEEVLNHMRHLGVSHDEISKEVVGISRVVGGKPSQPAAWPWVVSIYKNGIFHCGGVLINELWIVTAAHCVDRFWFFYYEVQAGMLRRFSYSPMEQNRWVTIAIPHEGYDKRSLKNDISLVKLSSSVRFNRFVRPICLPSESTAGKDFLHGPAPKTICTTVGWGATIEHGADPDHMREVEIPILDRCKHIEDQEGDEICAGLLEGGRDACQGDSGGPLMCRNVNNPSQWYLAGIVSHGEGCARPNEPGVYTKVSKYVGWIAENIRDGKFVGRFPLQRCPGHTCRGTKRCLPKKRQCDKIVDCLFGDDETDCWQSNGHPLLEAPKLSSRKNDEDFLKMATIGTGTENKQVEETTTISSFEETTPQLDTRTAPQPERTTEIFKCKKMLQVIPFSQKCDKVVQCEDGSDEDDCSCVDYLKKSEKGAICDGVTDCKDMSDEVHCGNCYPSQFFCRVSKKCIPLSSRCDGKSDCAKSEDEWECAALTNGATLILDSDLRPKQSMKGIITINRFGVWRPLCTNASADSSASIATNLCNLLGFEEYSSFHKLPVGDKPLDVTIESFQHSSLSATAAKSASCSGLFVGCSNVSLEGNVHELYRDNITSQLELYTAPWNAVIYLDGHFRCMGTILNAYWIVTTLACFQGQLLEKNYVAVLLGKGKSHLDVEGPHERAILITGIARLSNSEVIGLRTKEKIYFTRYIKPAHLTTRPSDIAREKCVAIGVETEKSSIVFLQSMAECERNFRCFRPRRTIAECQRTSLWNGVITCDSRQGWYPAALFSNFSGPCDFSNFTQYTSIADVKTRLQLAMGDNLVQVSMTACDGFRCHLGQCIETSRICNGIPDCRGGEDEDYGFCKKWRTQCHLTGNCTNYTECKWSELQCQNGQCIPKSSFCDTIDNCGDYSDEPNVCSCGNYLKLAHPAKICDGTVDCWDRSDEDPKSCKCDVFRNMKCGRSEFCVSKEMICDGFKDCPSGEDESTCHSLRTNFDRPNSGQVMTRTAGVWHSGCFARNHTTSELEEICTLLGFTGGSARQLTPPKGRDNVTITLNPVMDRFDVVWIRRESGNKLKLLMRTGNEPYVKFVQDDKCHKLYIECLY